MRMILRKTGEELARDVGGDLTANIIRNIENPNRTTNIPPELASRLFRKYGVAPKSLLGPEGEPTFWDGSEFTWMKSAEWTNQQHISEESLEEFKTTLIGSINMALRDLSYGQALTFIADIAEAVYAVRDEEKINIRGFEEKDFASWFGGWLKFYANEDRKRREK